MTGLTVFVQDEESLSKLQDVLTKLSYVKGVRNISLQHDKKVDDEGDYLHLIEASLKEEWEHPENDHWDSFIEKAVK